MIGPKKEPWQELCEQAANEQDGEKLSQLVAEIDRMLQEKQDRLDRKHILKTSTEESKTPQQTRATD
jgi:hypothetical protein